MKRQRSVGKGVSGGSKGNISSTSPVNNFASSRTSANQSFTYTSSNQEMSKNAFNTAAAAALSSVAASSPIPQIPQLPNSSSSMSTNAQVAQNTNNPLGTQQQQLMAAAASYLAQQQQLQQQQQQVTANIMQPNAIPSLQSDQLVAMLQNFQKAGGNASSNVSTGNNPAPASIPGLVLPNDLSHLQQQLQQQQPQPAPSPLPGTTNSQSNPLLTYMNFFARAAAAAAQQPQATQPQQQPQLSHSPSLSQHHAPNNQPNVKVNSNLSVSNPMLTAAVSQGNVPISAPSSTVAPTPTVSAIASSPSSTDLTSLLKQHQAAQQHANLVQQNVVAAAAATVAQQQQQQNQQQQQQNKPQNFAAVAQAAAAQMSMSAVVAQQASLSVQRAVQGGSIHKWKIEEIESHIQLLRDAGRPIPNQLQLVLEEARRREHKKTAKRVANRKSACTSRARKKALVEEMTKTNARLKRQAQILSLLPDLVMATTVDGVVTFCSAQVGNVLRLEVDDVMDGKFVDLVMPRSKGTFTRLVSKLVAAANNEEDVLSDSPMGNSNSSSDAAVVSEQSFPPAVVNATNSNKDASRSSSSISTGSANSNNRETVGPSTSLSSKIKLPCKKNENDSDDSEKIRASQALNRNVESHNAVRRAALASANGHTDDVHGAAVTANNADARLSSLQHVPKIRKDNVDTKKAFSSSKNSRGGNIAAGMSDRASNTPKNMPPDPPCEDASSASSDSLLRGVEEQQHQRSSTNREGSPSSPSLPKHGRKRSRQNRNDSSDDSGYIEGSESLPSSDDSLSEGRRIRRYAPACRLLMIRSDLSTVWCEVTSSIRTRCLRTEADEAISPFEKPVKGKSATQQTSLQSSNTSDSGEEFEMKELLLCLRPIREGSEPAPPNLQFKARAPTPEHDAVGTAQPVTSSSTNTDNGTGSSTESRLSKAKGQGEHSVNKDKHVVSMQSSENQKIKSKSTTAEMHIASSSVKVSSSNGTSSMRPNFGVPAGGISNRSHSNYVGEHQQNDSSSSSSNAVSSRFGGNSVPTDTEKSVVESLMLMSNKLK